MRATVLVAVALLVVGSLFVFRAGGGVSAQPPPSDGSTGAQPTGAKDAARAAVAPAPSKPKLKLLGTVEGVAVRHIRYQQTVNGIPVEGAFVTQHINKQTGGTLYWTNRSVTAPVRPPDAVPAMALADAVPSARAAAGVRVSRGDATTELVYLPEDGQLRLAWKVLVPALEPLGDWLVFLDAQDGSAISTHNVIFTNCPSPPTPGGCVFDPNAVVTLGDWDALADNNDSDSLLLTSLRVPVSLPGITSVGNLLGQLIGEYVDLTAPGITGAYLPAGVCQDLTHTYNRTRSDDCFEEVMAYFHIDRFQRYIQSLGFSIYASPIPVHAHYMSDCNAFYSSVDLGLHFGDGDHPDCAGHSVDSVEDADIILHEYGHALLDYQVPGMCYYCEAGAIHEGFADLVAALFYFNANPAWDAACMAEWGLGPNPSCIRRVDGSKHYPEDLVGEPHDDGEIWSGAIWEVFQDLGGNVAARDKVVRLLLESHWYLNPYSTLPDAADAVVSADTALYGGADVPLLEAVFDARGLVPPPPPPNDDFDNRMPVLSLPFTHSQSTFGATIEAGEPSPCGSVAATVWFAYTALEDGALSADTIGSGYDTVLAAYHGPPSLTSLVNDACNDDSVELQSQISFPVTAGVTYYFQAGGFLGETGDLLLHVSAVDSACIDRLGDSTCNDPVNDPDDDGCTDAEEQSMEFDPYAWYDFYDVPVPAKPDAGPGSGANGVRSQSVTMADVLAVLFYVGTQDNMGPNTNGVDYDTIKGVDLDGDTTNDILSPHDIQEGVKYDRSPSADPNPPWEAGPPSGAVNMADVLAVLAQVGLSCTGPP